ncbi:conserved exported hypothetical protein [Candidatus Desulfosporosinus infrequens]|uniref:SbsA Ig-like domain-containing protein n=1 Tax=Candidatus Desulfosporosinus infrequens TaxID=2043169 RepID=A0A2U3L137_9FIRM|nr:conserved exported hypothetical protein [Candidatus Desulfosporosinus infrequens]
MINRKIRSRSGLFGILIITFLLSVFPLVSYAYAAGGDGTGGANGVMKPLGLVSVTLDDGTNVNKAQNIPLKPKFTLHFDKNVVYLIYWEQNTRCFHLYDNNGQELAINLTKIDDTVDFSKRQYIWVEPVEALSPGANYKLYVAPNLLAKNGGSTLGMTTNNQGVTINFKTTGMETVAPSVAASAQVAAPDTVAATLAPAPAATPQTVTPSTPSTQVVASDPATTPAAAVAASAAVVTAAQNATSTAAPASDNNSTSVDVNTTNNDVTKKDSVSSDSPVTPKSNAESDLNQNNSGAQTGLTDQKKADAAQFAANEQARRVQNYVAVIAVIILLVWIGVEIMRRRRKRG